MAKSKAQSKKELLAGIDLVNTQLEEEAREFGLGRKNSRQILTQLESDPRMHSARAKLEFREIVRRALMGNWDEKKEMGHLPVGNRRALEHKGARLLDLNPVTTKRYMDVLRQPGGPFGGLGDDVYLNQYYVKPEDDDYWLDEEQADE